jgi:ABC-type multidrug transport system ATPase subunit
VFLDEPTSGMDSLTAMKVIEVVAKLAKRGRTVVAVIHQPNSQIVQMFDQLMLLSLGNIIYFVGI